MYRHILLCLNMFTGVSEFSVYIDNFQSKQLSLHKKYKVSHLKTHSFSAERKTFSEMIAYIIFPLFCIDRCSLEVCLEYSGVYVNDV